MWGEWSRCGRLMPRTGALQWRRVGGGGGTRVLMGSGMGLAPTQRISAKNSH